MTLQSFIKLCPNSQQERVFDYGIFIADRKNQGYIIYLYALDDFYVELYYIQKTTALSHIVTFQSIERLEPYLVQIDINGLFQ
jgi:hypothetical protein